MTLSYINEGSDESASEGSVWMRHGACPLDSEESSSSSEEVQVKRVLWFDSLALTEICALHWSLFSPCCKMLLSHLHLTSAQPAFP